MPVPARTVHTAALDVRVLTHRSAADIPAPVWATWRRYETAANIMLPSAEAALRREVAGAPPTPGQLWISLSSRTSNANGETSATVDLVLSCTEWAMGTYPVFIFCNPSSLEAMSPSTLASRVSMLAAELLARVPVERVYSIFAPTRVTKIFARVWSNMTGAQIESEPYYSAVFSYCTPMSSASRRPQPLTGEESKYTLRLAEEADIPAVASLCKGFASTSVRRASLILLQPGSVANETRLPSNSSPSLSVTKVHERRQPISSAIASCGCTKLKTLPARGKRHAS